MKKFTPQICICDEVLPMDFGTDGLCACNCGRRYQAKDWLEGLAWWEIPIRRPPGDEVKNRLKKLADKVLDSDLYATCCMAFLDAIQIANSLNFDLGGAYYQIEKGWKAQWELAEKVNKLVEENRKCKERIGELVEVLETTREGLQRLNERPLDLRVASFIKKLEEFSKEKNSD